MSSRPRFLAGASLRTRLLTTLLPIWLAALVLLGGVLHLLLDRHLHAQAAADLARSTAAIEGGIARFVQERQGDLRLLATHPGLAATASDQEAAAALRAMLGPLDAAYGTYQDLRLGPPAGTDPAAVAVAGGAMVLRQPLPGGRTCEALVPLAALLPVFERHHGAGPGRRGRLLDGAGRTLLEAGDVSEAGDLGERVAGRDGLPWTVDTSISHQALTAPLPGMLLAIAVTLLAVLVTGAAAIAWVAHRTTQPLQRLADYARTLAAAPADRTPPPPAMPSAEAATLGGVLAEMAESLHGRMSDLMRVQERLQLATRVADLGLWDWDARSHHLVWDEAMHRMFGIAAGGPEQGGLYAAFLARVHPEDRARIERLSLETMATGRPFHASYRIAHPDLGERVIQAQAITAIDDGGAATRLVGICLDITERTRDQERLLHAQADLARKEEQLRLALESSAVGLWDWAVPTGQVEFSDTWMRMLGHQPGSLPGHVDTWQALVHPEDLPWVGAAVQEHLAGSSRIYRTEHRCRHHDGHWVWILDTGRVTDRDAEGRPQRMIGTHIDITALKNVEEALREARAEAERAVTAKSEFLATMSHEIRTPLSGVLGMAELLIDSGLGSEQREMAVTVRNSAKALFSILNDILDLSKIEAGRMEVERLPFDAFAAASEVVALFHGQAQAKELRLELLGSGPITALGDVARFRQVLSNLVSNALKFTARGSVLVALERAGGDRPPGQLAVAVRDTGIGIPPEGMDRLFQRFSQVDASTARRYGGTGLGLAICRLLLDRMDGSIAVESTPGAGSTFRFLLPLAAMEPGQAANETSGRFLPLTAESPLAGLAVLLAEDNPVNSRIAVTLLRRLGCQVTAVADGAAALDAWRDRHHRVVLMDCQMPGMDGYEATRRLRLEELAEGLPRALVIALTANAFAEDRQACTDAGMDAFLPKPIDIRTLEEEIRKGLERG